MKGWYGVLLALLCVSSAAGAVQAVDARDFSGIWENRADQFRAFDPTLKVSSAEQPPLKEPWLSEWHATRARVKEGMKVWDPDIACLPPGMPRTMNMSYPFEILMNRKRITMLTEYYNETRRIFMDGRGHPAPDDLEPTFRGHSIGHWEDNTLVIDTTGIRYETVIDLAMVPHSDQMHVIERAQRVGPDSLTWNITLIDPVVLAAPWSIERHFVRSPKDTEIREYVCAENNRLDQYVLSPEDAKYQKPDRRLKTLP